MISLDEWVGSASFPARPWLLLGKGPTFDRRSEFDLTGFNTVGLNHVVDAMPVDIAHVIDLDVVVACADALRTRCRYLVMPRHPHVDFAPSRHRLEHFFDTVPVLRELDAEGRLVWYSSSLARVAQAKTTVQVRYFSSEAALSVLGALGARDVRTLGIDGGRSYGRAFGHLDDVTRLANGEPSFDQQFAALEQIRRHHGMTLAPLVPGLRIFVGASEQDLPAFRTLAHSITEHSSIPVQVSSLADVDVPTPRARKNRPRTRFSFARFAIPELCGHQGRAVYLDADMLVFGDVAELADLPFDGAHLLCSRQMTPPAVWRDSTWFHPGRQFSVMVMDCEQLNWDVREIVDGLDRDRYSYRDLMFDMTIVPEERIAESVPEAWNHLERYEPDATKLLHYTVGDQQPWRCDANPLGYIWERAYEDAVADRAVPWREVEPLVRSGKVKPSLADAFDAVDQTPNMVPSLARQSVRAGWPLLRRIRNRWPDTPLSAGIDRVYDLARSKL